MTQLPAILDRPNITSERELQLAISETIAALQLPQVIASAKTSDVEQHRANAVKELAAMHTTGWGMDGDVQETTERVSLKQLWYYAPLAIPYTDEQIQQMANSLALSREEQVSATGQINPIICVKVKDPRDKKSGGTNGTYLIVDGVRRYLGLARSGFQHAIVIVREYFGIYDYLLQVCTAKITVYAPSALEVGRMTLACIGAYNLRTKEREQFGGDEEPAPTLEMMSRRFGKSDSYLSACQTLARMPQAFLNYINNELATTGQYITDGQALEILRVPMGERMQLAQEIAQRNAGQVLPQSKVRARATAIRLVAGKPTMYWPRITSTVPVGILTVPQLDLEHTPLAIAIMRYASDLRTMVSLAIAQITEHHEPVDKRLQQLLRAVEDPALVEFSAETDKSYFEESDDSEEDQEIIVDA